MTVSFAIRIETRVESLLRLSSILDALTYKALAGEKPQIIAQSDRDDVLWVVEQLLERSAELSALVLEEQNADVRGRQ